MNYEDRIKNIKNVMAGNTADHVPILADFETSYACEYGGLDFMKASWDYTGIIQAYERLLTDFEMD
ncbi:MAG: hypothetical protein RR614_15195, partial [Eubacterium sp.]